MKHQFQVNNQEIIIDLKQKRKGVYWSYQDTPYNYGPFKSDQQALNDAKLYSQYGTTNKLLIPESK
jgi:hypothetical protein